MHGYSCKGALLAPTLVKNAQYSPGAQYSTAECTVQPLAPTLVTNAQYSLVMHARLRQQTAP